MKTLSLNEFHQKSKELKNGEVLLDVRNPDEFSEARIDNALNIPVSELATRYDELKKFSAIYIYCKRGGRAQTAYLTLQNLGFNNLICLAEAGMDAWIAEGFETING